MILTVLQARMGSRRLPGKAMATLQGQPMIIRQLERLRGARCQSRIIVATSAELRGDARIAELYLGRHVNRSKAEA